MRNKKVSVEKLVEGVSNGIASRSQDKHVLLIEDTSEINYQKHVGRTKGLGTVGNGTDAGLFMHPVLAIDAESDECIGLAHLHIWMRSKSKKADYKKQPIEEKESYRWIDAAQKGIERTQTAKKITVIADRESDIYAMWSRIPSERVHLLIRASWDRKLDQQEAKLFEWMSLQPTIGEYQIEVPEKPGYRTAHQAKLKIKIGVTQLKKSKINTDPNAPESVEVSAIDVEEDASTVIVEEQAVHWRLLTTHEIKNEEDALRCIHWYKQRWHIEQLFRTLKKQGLDLESSLLEEGSRLEKLAVFACSAAVRTMQMTLAREGKSNRPASDAFTAEEITVLERIQVQKEGKTEKQKNPHAKHSLAWAAWIIARLGGWKGYTSERKPGPITMLIGLKAFESIYYGYLMAVAS